MVKKLSLFDLKKEFITEWKNKTFKRFVIVSIFLILAIIITSLRISFINDYFNLLVFLMMSVWVFYYTKYELISKWDKKNPFEKTYTLYVDVIAFAFTVVYLLIMVLKLFNIGIFFFIFSIFLFFLMSAIYALVSLITVKRSIVAIIISYIFVAFFTIVLFGFLFATSTGFNKNQILNESGNKINGAWEFTYFSSINFYSTTYDGGFRPQGNIIQTLLQIEAGIAAILHIILLGWVISYSITPSSKK